MPAFGVGQIDCPSLENVEVKAWSDGKLSSLVPRKLWADYDEDDDFRLPSPLPCLSMDLTASLTTSLLEVDIDATKHPEEVAVSAVVDRSIENLRDSVAPSPAAKTDSFSAATLAAEKT
jgi:hypothetical protein